MKEIRPGIILVVNIVLAIFFNISSFLFGRKASFSGFLFSVFYCVIWGLLFRYACKNKLHNLILPSTVFWIFTCLTAIATIYINFTGISLDFLIPLAVLFLTPMNGVNFFEINNIIALSIMIIVSIYFIIKGLYSIIKTKNT